MAENKIMLLEAEISKLITTRYNEVTSQVEQTKDGVTYTSLTDREEKGILRTLRNNGFKVSLNTIRDILQSDFSPTFNPFKNYFNNLPTWDGEDHIGQLIQLVKVENNTYWDMWFKKWIVGLVASTIDKSIVNHQMLVLIGGQGIGKTTFFNKLIPKELANYSNTGYMNPESKDAQTQASECFIINIDEMSSMSPKNLEAFKQLITQSKFRVRRPYAVNVENLIKRASFCGSTNDEQFLFDKTGNRRFLCFKSLDIDLDKLQEVDIDKLYAQAYYLYNENFRYWFDKQENNLIEENNKGFVIVTPEDEAILKYFEPCDKGNSDILCTKMTASQITMNLASRGALSNTASNSQKVGKSLIKLGFQRYKSNGRMLYRVKMKNS